MRPVAKKDTNRIAKVNSLIQKELGPILREYLDWQNGLVTVTKVDTSKDMKYTKVWISIFNTPNSNGKKSESPKFDVVQADKKILDFLAKNIYDIQGEVNKHFSTKIIPRISFHLDTSPRYVEHIDELIREVHEEEQE